MIETYCRLLGFPEEATAHLTAVYTEMCAKTDIRTRFLGIEAPFLRSERAIYEGALQLLADECGVDRRTVDMLFLLHAAPALRERYAQKGIADHIFVETMTDLRYKLLECRSVYGVWGTFVTFWYPGFYRCERFALGRLQYERRSFQYPAYGPLREGDAVLNCHIPSSGPLTPDAVMGSLKRAYEFYRDLRCEGALPVVCHSWLLYPPHRALFGRNTQAFFDLFHIMDSKATPENPDFWRLFHREYRQETLPEAPEDTSMHRRFKQYLLEGNSMGSGYGVLLFDGERILTP